ncbi:hypothetical protein [Brazilian marseillevirus]|uniref:hypothetical protein n=1 Tax=Brazilian marseillevirus TaxID=1813599 RepID=UPI000784771A|nr:hypothetical protein A3303_gp353 [Brazilian marseillevirus]AMQ10861.1 hypothetical protein [Brazilian marseillevirus]
MEGIKHKNPIGFVCPACDFSSREDEIFLSHCENEHVAKGDISNKMRCQTCCFETTSIALFRGHLEKKMHRTCAFYTLYKNLFFGNEGMAYRATVSKFGNRRADKAVSMTMAIEATERTH